MALSAIERIRQQREATKLNRAGRTQAYKFKPGKTVISILPGHEDPEAFYRKCGMHYIKSVKDEFIVAVGDRQHTFDESCPVRDGLVDTIRYANSIGDDDLAESAKKSLAKPTFLYNVIVHQDPDKKAEEVPQLVSMSETLNDSLFGILEEYLADGSDDLLRWNDRIAFVVEREGTGQKDTRYKIYPAPKRVSVAPAKLAQAVNLEEFVQAQFTDSVKKALAYISVTTGKAVAGTAFAAALTSVPGSAVSAAALAAPSDDGDLLAGDDDDLLAESPAAARVAEAPALASSRTTDAVFEDVAPSTASDDLLAEIDALSSAA